MIRCERFGLHLHVMRVEYQLLSNSRLTQLGRVDAGELLPVNRVEGGNGVIAEWYDLVNVVRELVVVVT